MSNTGGDLKGENLVKKWNQEKSAERGRRGGRGVCIPQMGVIYPKWLSDVKVTMM